MKSYYARVLPGLFFVMIILPGIMILCPSYFQNTNGAYVKAKPTSGGPTVNDPNLREIGYSNHKYVIPWTK
ncbi:MAG: hypothetical protein ABJB85_09050 [Nitrososphaerota archaeon]